MQIVIDSCCATFAEVQKRGEDFWQEFELYVADLLVGTVVNVALVGMLAPYARIGKVSVSKGMLGQLQKAYNALPSRYEISWFLKLSSFLNVLDFGMKPYMNQRLWPCTMMSRFCFHVIC